jgi:catechol 2,3-dioxygenase-like lactoylglutathione lyase family enzyme
VAGFHHVELWISDFEQAAADWGWLLGQLRFSLEAEWPQGQSWSAGGAYLTLTTSPNLTSPVHDRRRVGLNHLAFKAGSQQDVDAIIAAAPTHGWRPLYQERFPHAGGEDHYAGWLENSAGFKAEIVADPPTARS